jgi:hypothetical protein
MNPPLATVPGAAARRHRRLALPIIGLLVAFGATACQPVPAGPTVVHGGTYTAGTITPDHGDAYTIVDQGSGFTAKAPKSNASANLRLAVVKDSAPMSVDQSACINWSGPNSNITQPGLVLRNHTDNGRTQAIMVTNNIIFAFRPGFNVHLADSTAPTRLKQIGSGSLTEAVGGFYDPKPFPWRICARAQGTTVDVKAWSVPSFPTEPAWGDPKFGYSVQVPSDWVFAGRPGAYIGHIAPGGSAKLTSLTTSQITGTPGDTYWNQVLSWTDKLFVATYGRTPTASERTSYAERVTRSSASSTATAVALSDEGRQASGRLIYSELIGGGSGRAAQPAYTVAYNAADSFAAGLMASPQFPGGTTDEQFIGAVYQTVLGRAPSSSEVAYQVGRITSGVTRRATARDIFRSNENRRAEVRSSIEFLYGRPATDAEITKYAAMWQTLGFDTVRLRAAMLTSVAPVFK